MPPHLPDPPGPGFRAEPADRVMNHVAEDALRIRCYLDRPSLELAQKNLLLACSRASANLGWGLALQLIVPTRSKSCG